MIGIIGAMEIEVNALISMLENKTLTKISGINYYSGKISDKDIVIAKCGVGKVNAAICAQTMILTYSPDVLINTGVAGSLSEKLNICDIAVATDVVQHDMDTTPLGDPAGFITGIDLVKIPCDIRISQLLYNCATSLNEGNCILGTIASGDQFLNSDAQKKKIIDNFGAIAGEMEGASIGHVAYMNNVSFSVLRVMSDNASGESNIDFPKFCELAAEKSIKICKSFIESY